MELSIVLLFGFWGGFFGVRGSRGVCVCIFWFCLTVFNLFGGFLFYFLLLFISLSLPVKLHPFCRVQSAGVSEQK